METDQPARGPRHLGERGRRWFDRALVGLLLLPVPLFLPGDGGWAVALLVAGQALPLLWRRTRPATVFALVALASAAQVPVPQVDGPLHTQVAFPVAVYSATRYGGWRTGVVGLVVGLAASVVAGIDWARDFDVAVRLDSVAPATLTCAAFVVAAWALGSQGRTRAAYVASLLERQQRIEREAAQQVELAAADERARIAREMHDVVAHGLTTIVVQADGGRYVARQDPARAADALDQVAAAARDSLAQMRRLLGVLREPDGTAPDLAPQPRLTDLPALLEQAGPDVDVRLDGLDTAVPDDVALTAYRVAQEALTNVRRHAGPAARTSVRVAVRAGDAVTVEVLDDGRGAATDGPRPAGGAEGAPGAGLGLVGMRERVAAHDGELETGPRPGGGYRVRARIPL